MNIAVIGAGSSGLVTLKYLLDKFPNANIRCYEQGDSVRGCWGNQREDFVSTSTKYTTQFSCYRKWTSTVTSEKDFDEFYKGAEFGDYLDAFAEAFDLRKYINFGVQLESFEEIDDKWRLCLTKDNAKDGATHYEIYDALFICTGLVNQKVPVESSKIPIADNPEAVRNATVVVVGGGESATDIANHLAKAEYNNKVFLSLRSGVRVSPRYHPIRGVPSDFLRNRLLLSFNKGLRNWLGEGFVSFRIRFNKLLAALFPHQESENQLSEEQSLRKEWDMKLKARAKGKLFNVFHNKSDAFLDAVAQKRLSIIGPATDSGWNNYYDFEQSRTFELQPDVLVPSTGYRSLLSEFSDGKIQLRDFYQGCVYQGHGQEKQNNLFLIGFARPIIGNIPTISEMQARYAVGILSGDFSLPTDVANKQEQAWQRIVKDYATINTDNVYPVEQIPYCDSLAKDMGIMPSLANITSIQTWLKLMLVPASTMHYVDEYFDSDLHKQEKIQTPAALIAILFVLRLFEFPYQYWKRNYA